MEYHTVKTARTNWDVPSTWRAALTNVATRAAAFLAASSAMGRGTVWMAATRQTVVGFTLTCLQSTFSWTGHIYVNPHPPGADEGCSTTEFTCTNGQCVSGAMRCDGHSDCRDGSDEESCTKAPACATKHRCPHSKECLVQEWICDGHQDCKDGTDEKVQVKAEG